MSDVARQTAVNTWAKASAMIRFMVDIEVLAEDHSDDTPLYALVAHGRTTG